MSYEEAQDYLVHDLGAMYDAERRFLEALQEMQQRATDTRLQQSVATHVDQTRVHVESIEEAFSQLGLQLRDATNAAAQGLVRHARDSMARAGSTAMLDVAICAAAAAVEQVEIACYTSLIQVAEATRQGEPAALLRQTLHQEQETARLLDELLPLLLRATVEDRAESPRTGAARATDEPLDEQKGAREIDAGLVEANGTLIDEQGSALTGRERVP